MALVVIVDDQAINLKILERFAQAAQPDVVVRGFTAPKAALQFIASQPPDLIVTDFVMPEMSGEEFITACRQLPSAQGVPIIVVTAYEDRVFRYRALDAGASEFLLSPVDGREFCTRARNLLSLWHHQKLLKSRASDLKEALEASVRQHAEAIRLSEENLRRVVNTVPALIRATGRSGRILFLNSVHEDFFDLNGADRMILAQTDLFGETYGRRHQDLDDQVIEAGAPLFDIEETLRDRKDDERVLLTTKAPLYGHDGQIDQIVTVSLDITERKRGEQAVRESEERFRSLVEGSVLGIVIERDGVPIFANRTFARIFGYDDPEEIVALPSLERLFAKSDHSQGYIAPQPGHFGTSPSDAHELKCVRKDGGFIWVEVQTQEVSWKGAFAFQSTVADVTLRKAYEDRLQRQANFDEVTGLPNRMLALDRLRSAVVSAMRHRHKGGVLFLDLDQFKKINDTWGHATGDHLLKMAADRIRSCVREEDTVARLGGDEFTIILPNIASSAHTEPVVHKILSAFSNPFVLDLHEAFVTASIGISVFPDDGEDAATLMQNADAAMYRAKEQGRNTFHYFTAEMNEVARERMRLEGHLVHALDRSEFVIHFQPIVDIRSHQLAGAEALLRWRNPQLGHMMPERFVPLAEDTGLIVAIGQWVLDEACRYLGAWRRSGLPQLTLAVNVSSRQWNGRGLVNSVAAALQRYGVPPHCLELEVTEGCLMSDLGETAAALRELDRMGVRLALDDFGTGYSCLSHLKQLPVDSLKIDKSFIANVLQDAGDATVVEAIIAMAHRLGIRVIAEGVEKIEQLEYIRVRGCDLAQGYIFSPALAADEFRDWCAEWQRSRRYAL
ncbi:MAG: EAL domain-containing protein [Rhodospirillales bacterium]|nr:EAL domain-containing protein [Rhodospirillales bacterium]